MQEMQMQQILNGENQEDVLRNILTSHDPNATVTKTNAVYEVKYMGEDLLIGNDLKIIEKIEANQEEWTFNENTRTLTAYLGDLTTKRGVQEIGELIVPNYYNGKRVKNIGNNIFTSNTDLEKLTISEGIENIGVAAFYSCTNLSDFILPNSLTSIGQTSFYNCNKLTGDLIISDNVTSIGVQAFDSCSSLNGKLKLGKNLQTIGNFAFSGCNLTGDLIIPDSVTQVGAAAFRGCVSLNGKLVLGKNIQTIGASALYNCTNLKGDIIIPNAVPSIGGWTFTGCNSLNSIKFLNRNIEIYDDNSTIPGNIEIIGYEDSTAYRYADKYSKTFRKIPE